ncbi:hypothetical protein F4860DRAFT_522071 [Xylaria cubensis]|nr:hypothetical protein F4860DRAFT_522071 [Xylaria cubensis]
MSNSNYPVRPAEGDVWITNATLIKQLYISERKTLKQVKELLEGHHGFPTFPLSTYETKLRDKLGLRKKLKKGDWTAVYQHIRNRGGKETGIYLNGTRIPWEKAWKEIRRSGARVTSDGRPLELPAGVVVRSPSRTMHATPLLSPPISSPVSSLAVPIETQPASASTLLQGSLSALSTIASHDNILHFSTILYRGATDIVREVSAVSDNFNLLYHRVYLENIPVNTFRKNLHSIISNDLQRPRNSNVTNDPPFNVAILEDIVDFFFGLNFRISSFQQLEYNCATPASNFDSYHFLTKAIYLLSNKIIAWNSGHNYNRGKLFDILFTRLHERVLLRFLQSDLPTARAALEALVPFAYENGYRDAFIFLLKVGLKRPSWILASGHTYLSMAASLGSLDTIHCLLRIGARADDKLNNYKLPIFSTAILESVGAESMACVEALIHNCDVNRTIERYRRSSDNTFRNRSNFSLFFSAMGAKGVWLAKFNRMLPDWHLHDRVWVNLSINNDMHSRVLGMFLDHGADVDSLWDGHHDNTRIFRLHAQNGVSSESKLTVLDQSYYWDTKFYTKLSPYSSKEATRITRPGICLSAKQGKEFLQAYLDSRLAQHPADRTKLLELVLAEQFFMEDFSIDTQVVQGLVNFGVDIKLPTMITDFSVLLHKLVSNAVRFGFTDAVSSLFNILLCEGATIDHVVVDAAVAKNGLGLLPKLLHYGADIRNYGANALCSAARLNNFEAVSWLLQAGVDINASISTPVGTMTIIAYLNIREDLFDRMRLFLDSANCPEDLATDQESLLASWNPKCIPGRSQYSSSDIYELLVERGCPIRGDCQLAFFIRYGGRHEVIFKLLDAGVDVNAYSKRVLRHLSRIRNYKQYPIQAAARRGDRELISQLVIRGANINQPAIGWRGRTALQSACEWNARPSGDQSCKLALIKMLIDLGADINAPAAKYLGMTALQIAAYRGDMATALFLLENGANINAPPAKKNGLCALDAAAGKGRLDMVHLLLSLAAHSHYRGESGYEGAIRLALENQHYAVADLVREQIKTFGNCIIIDLGADHPLMVLDDSGDSSGNDIGEDSTDYFESERED